MKRTTGLSVVASLVLVGAVVAGVAATGPGVAGAASGFGSDWPVYHHDFLGSGVDAAGTSIDPASPAWTSPVLDGQVYGEPLVEAGRVVVATENNTVYSLAANSGAVLWSTHIASPVASSSLPCGDISPNMGITSTPVIDAAAGEIFVVADEPAAGTGAAHHLVGLDLYSGGVRLDQVVDPVGSTPLAQLQRAALTLDQGQVLIGFGGNDGDCSTYHGWLVAVPEGGGAARTFEVSANAGDSQGAIWMGGAAPEVDGAGNIWFATGNGRFSSSTDPYDDSDGVLELSPSLGLEQYFAPSTWYSDNGSDRDLGSSSPAFLSGNLVFQAGKSQTAYVLNQAALGGVGGQAASAGSYCGSDVDGGSAAVGDVVYAPCLSGVVKTQVTPGSPPTITSVWQTSTGSGGPPIVAGGLVWTIDHSNGNLYGLDLSTGSATQTFAIGAIANHFPTPTVADGLLLAASSTQVHAFVGTAGLPPPPTPGPRLTVVNTLAVQGPGHSNWVYWETSDALWHGPLGVGNPGSTFSAPSVGVGPNGLPTVAVQGPANRLWVYWETSDAQWHGPLGVGNPGSTYSAPSVGVGPSGLPTVAVQGPANTLWVYWQAADANWYGPLGVGSAGSTFSAPSVAVGSDGLPTVAAQGPGNATWVYWQAADANWYGPLEVGNPGATYSAPSVGVGSNGLPTVAAQGQGNGTWVYWQTGDAQWHGPLGVGGPGSTYSAPSVGVGSGGLPTVAAQGPGNSTWVYWEAGNANWYGPFEVGNPGSTYSAPSVAVGSNGLPTVAAQGPGGTTWLYWQTGDAQWHGPLQVGNPGSTYSAPSVAEQP